MHCRTAWEHGAVQRLQYTAACLGAVGNASPTKHGITIWGQWAVQLLQQNASLPGDSGQWDSFNTLPHCLRAVGSATPAIRCLTA